jgi:hypothetical protein
MTTTTNSIHLGPIYAGLTLAAQLVNTAGVVVGDPITTGFVEIGNGDYLWTATIPTSFQGGVKVYEAGSPGAVLAIGAIQESAVNAGSTAYTNTVTDDSSNPLDGVEVWVTSDSGGVSTVASTTTNTLGAFTVYLDPGTYYQWLAKGGYNFPNPTTITVT